jgi:hypothetical protein
MGEYPALSEAEIALISRQKRPAGYFHSDPEAVPGPELLDWLTS